jgi:hypothetical protein
VLNQVNIHLVLVLMIFLLGLIRILQYGTICLLAIHVDHIVLFAS